MSKSKH